MLAKDNKVLEYYNKEHKANGSKHGTLMGNWWEEQVLREQTGVGRTTYIKHHTKERQKLYTLPSNELKLQQIKDLDSTYDRTLGKQQYNEYSLQSQQIGQDTLQPKSTQQIPPRQALLDKHYAQLAQQHINQQDSQQAHNHHNRTLYQQDYQPNDLTINTIGTKIMKTQDLKDIPK